GQFPPTQPHRRLHSDGPARRRPGRLPTSTPGTPGPASPKFTLFKAARTAISAGTPRALTSTLQIRFCGPKSSLIRFWHYEARIVAGEEKEERIYGEDAKVEKRQKAPPGRLPSCPFVSLVVKN